MAGFLDAPTDVTVEEVAIETLNVEMIKQNYVVYAAGILLRIRTE